MPEFMQYIRRIEGNKCGPHPQVHLLYYRNIHPSRRIRIFVDHHWIYEGQPVHEPREYVLRPNAMGSPAFDALMGCPFPNSTTQQFHWDVVDAEFVDAE